MRRIRIPEDHPVVRFYGLPSATYLVEVGLWGWDDGDLFIDTPKGRWKLRHLKEMGNVEEVE